MIQELNFTPTEIIAVLIVSGILLLILIRSKTYVSIDIPEGTTAQKQQYNANYGAYIQAQNHYYN
ncbi:hypothetical protein JavanS419_0012 [Streptococcus satellite phage Javan419]|uniref:Uncharacterized protein n=1 Tax=Streptococcus phocae TaxID=119224 RepID=A0A0P6STC8_9STRE|nr:hypothetical protein [Streptococcus phocae]KPJ23047.1 hypothetical protein AKK44_01300 [Streptococcus phocae]QBX10227.1 hypothetical protein JavanS419_0012 [Streptococcus satellite phage Javan419]